MVSPDAGCTLCPPPSPACSPARLPCLSAPTFPLCFSSDAVPPSSRPPTEAWHPLPPCGPCYQDPLGLPLPRHPPSILPFPVGHVCPWDATEAWSPSQVPNPVEWLGVHQSPWWSNRPSPIGPLCLGRALCLPAPGMGAKGLLHTEPGRPLAHMLSPAGTTAAQWVRCSCTTSPST